MFAPLIGQLCAAVCSAAFAIGGPSATYDPYSTHPVYFFGVQVGVYLDDTQPDQCQDAAIERLRWQLVIAGVAPGDWAHGQCPAATFNALEWGRFWGKPPAASAYILESATLGPLSGSAPILSRQALSFRPRLILTYR